MRVDTYSPPLRPLVAGVIGDTITLFAAAFFAVGAVVSSTVARVAAATPAGAAVPPRCCLPCRPRPLAILSLAASLAAVAPTPPPPRALLRFVVSPAVVATTIARPSPRSYPRTVTLATPGRRCIL